MSASQRRNGIKSEVRGPYASFHSHGESPRYAGDFMPVAGNIKSHLSTFYVDRLIISTGAVSSFLRGGTSQFSSPRPARTFVRTRTFNTVTFPNVSRSREHDRWWSWSSCTIYKPPFDEMFVNYIVSYSCNPFYKFVTRVVV